MGSIVINKIGVIYMEKHKEFETALAISILYVAITSIFSLLTKVITVFVTGASLGKRIELFLFQNILWIIAVIVVIVTLRLYLRRNHQKNISDILKNPTTRLATGMLVALDGLINLSGLLPVYINSIMSSTQSSRQMGKIAESIIKRIVIGDVASILIILCQVIFGFCLVRPYLMKRQLNQ